MAEGIKSFLVRGSIGEDGSTSLFFKPHHSAFQANITAQKKWKIALQSLSYDVSELEEAAAQPVKLTCDAAKFNVYEDEEVVTQDLTLATLVLDTSKAPRDTVRIESPTFYTITGKYGIHFDVQPLFPAAKLPKTDLMLHLLVIEVL